MWSAPSRFGSRCAPISNITHGACHRWFTSPSSPLRQCVFTFFTFEMSVCQICFLLLACGKHGARHTQSLRVFLFQWCCTTTVIVFHTCLVALHVLHFAPIVLKIYPSFLQFSPIFSKGEKFLRKLLSKCVHESPIFAHFPPFSLHFPSIFPRFPPFPPISPHFPPFSSFSSFFRARKTPFGASVSSVSASADACTDIIADRRGSPSFNAHAN